MPVPLPPLAFRATAHDLLDGLVEPEGARGERHLDAFFLKPLHDALSEIAMDSLLIIEAAQ
jgi:hypothetical protein